MADVGVTGEDLLGGDGRTCFSISRDVSRMTMARWRPGDRIILIDGPIRKGSRVNGRPVGRNGASSRPRVKARSALDAENLLQVVAESFVAPIRPWMNAPPTKLHSGPWRDEILIERPGPNASQEVALCGAFDKSRQWC